MLAMRIDVSGFESGKKILAMTPDIIRKAVVGALSDTVDDLHTRQEMEMKSVFNKPSPYVLKGLKKSYPGGRESQSSRARFGQGVMRAGTYFEYFPIGKSPEDIVKPHVFGGSRSKKMSERRLQQIGALPQGGFTIMGNQYPRNSSGGIGGARYSEMLAAIGALSETARSSQPKSRQKNRKNVSFFLVRRGGVPIAVAERRGKDVRIMLAFAKSVNYQKRYDYFGVGQKQVAYSLPLHFNRIINRYMSRM